MNGSAPWVTLAARNNAEWCDLVCRMHGVVGSGDDLAWWCHVRTPVGYPDAVTLSPAIEARDLLARIDATGGCSVKDSFGALDLDAYGFRVLLDAHWIVHAATSAPASGPSPDWIVVRDVVGFELWHDAWVAHGGSPGVLGPALLEHEDVQLLFREVHGRVVAGAVLSTGSAAVGLSNVFTDNLDATGSWAGCLALVNALLPGIPVVGYETGAPLIAALANGFESPGALRVWLRDI